MLKEVIRIERTSPRDGVAEEPIYKDGVGYTLGNPDSKDTKHHAFYAIHTHSLDQAAALVEKGFSLRMSSKGRPASLISPKSLNIVYRK